MVAASDHVRRGERSRCKADRGRERKSKTKGMVGRASESARRKRRQEREDKGIDDHVCRDVGGGVRGHARVTEGRNYPERALPGCARLLPD
eukprot:6183898-Pleurochrysis_carterae.AAC.2